MYFFHPLPFVSKVYQLSTLDRWKSNNNYIYIYIYIHEYKVCVCVCVCMCVCVYVCVYIHNSFITFVALLLFAFCFQSTLNIIVTLISLCFIPDYFSICVIKHLYFIDRRYWTKYYDDVFIFPPD